MNMMWCGQNRVTMMHTALVLFGTMPQICWCGIWKRFHL